MKNKFKVLKTREFWVSVAIMIPVVVVFYWVMYLFGSPAVTHTAGSVTHVKTVSGQTTMQKHTENCNGIAKNCLKN